MYFLQELPGEGQIPEGPEFKPTLEKYIKNRDNKGFQNQYYTNREQYGPRRDLPSQEQKLPINNRYKSGMEDFYPKHKRAAHKNYHGGLDAAVALDQGLMRTPTYEYSKLSIDKGDPYHQGPGKHQKVKGAPYLSTRAAYGMHWKRERDYT